MPFDGAKHHIDHAGGAMIVFGNATAFALSLFTPPVLAVSAAVGSTITGKLLEIRVKQVG